MALNHLGLFEGVGKNISFAILPSKYVQGNLDYNTLVFTKITLQYVCSFTAIVLVSCLFNIFKKPKTRITFLDEKKKINKSRDLPSPPFLLHWYIADK